MLGFRAHLPRPPVDKAQSFFYLSAAVHSELAEKAQNGSPHDDEPANVTFAQS